MLVAMYTGDRISVPARPRTAKRHGELPEQHPGRQRAGHRDGCPDRAPQDQQPAPRDVTVHPRRAHVIAHPHSFLIH